MTLNEIIQAVRDELGESSEHGLWNNATIARWVHLSLNKHARYALSVEAEVKTTSLPGVQEYDLPVDFGELKNVRYADNDLIGLVPLVYVDKQSILSAYGGLDTLGTPYACYIYQRKLGLYPVPNKGPLLEHTFADGRCNDFLDITTPEGAYQAVVAFEVIEDDNSSSGGWGDYMPAAPMPGDVVEKSESAPTDLDPCRVYVSHIAVYLRRKGLPYPGNIQMVMSPLDDDEYAIYSKVRPAHDIETRPQWYNFDFTHSPIEVDEECRTWCLQLMGDADYNAAVTNAEAQSGTGVQVGVDTDDVCWFSLVRHTKDIQIDYYRNSVAEVIDFDEPLDLPFYPPDRCHDTIISLTLDYAMRRGQYDLRAAADYRTRAQQDMDYTRTQAAIKTRGDIMSVPQNVRLRAARGPYLGGPYLTYQNGIFYGRAW